MKFTILISTTFAGIALAAPLPQYNEPWTGFFGPDQSYYSPYLLNPYYTQGGNQLGQLPISPPYTATPPYAQYYDDSRAPVPPAPGPLDTPADQAPTTPMLPQITKPKITKPVSEKSHNKEPLSERLTAKLNDRPATEPVRQEQTTKSIVKEEDTKEGEFDKDAIRYHVNVGGVQKGGNGGTTNFHVFTDENGNKRFSDKLDDETEKYINENMIPKLGGKRKGKAPGGVWTVFGDN